MTDKSLIELEQKIVAYGDEREAGGVGFGNDADALLSEIRQRLAVVPSVPETGDWGIDLSTGRKILVYKNCSVIEDAQAELVLSLLAAAPQSPAIAAERVAELERDAARLDWLADPENMLGSVGLPRECVEPNIHSMREAIDMAMAMDKAIAGAGRG